MRKIEACGAYFKPHFSKREKSIKKLEIMDF